MPYPELGRAVDVGSEIVERLEIPLSPGVTAPLRAMTRPSKLAPVSSVSLAEAMIVPSSSESVRRMAESPTWRYLSRSIHGRRFGPRRSPRN
jgi:hypothetical protein